MFGKFYLLSFSFDIVLSIFESDFFYGFINIEYFFNNEFIS